MKKIPNHVHLPVDRMPKAWYNIQADMPNKLPPMRHPVTGEIAPPAAMEALFSPSLVEQEFTQERYIDIPERVRECYAQYRPSPLYRAYALEKALGTPAHIYYKYEGNNPSGSHKLNSAIPQAYYNAQDGVKRITTETGAGQWGTALAVATQMLGMALDVYMVRVSAQQKPYRKMLMEAFGANVIASPSDTTAAGRAILAEMPDTPGSLGMAISEAVEVAMADPAVKYCLGSVLNHVVLHQSVIGLELMEQLEMVDEVADIVIGCNGGGSNFGGIAFPLLGRDLREGKKHTRYIAVEPSACPKLTQGVYSYDFTDAIGMTPALPMYTLGHGFIPQGIHAGGLRYHADSPILSRLYHDGLIEAVAVDQTHVFESALLFAKHEIILPAPESAHAIAAAIDAARECIATGEEKVIVFGLSGNGNFDLAAYSNYLSGNVVDAKFSDEQKQQGAATLPDYGVKL